MFTISALSNGLPASLLCTPCMRERSQALLCFKSQAPTPTSQALHISGSCSLQLPRCASSFPSLALSSGATQASHFGAYSLLHCKHFVPGGIRRVAEALGNYNHPPFLPLS